jgi:transcriptional regulator with XRE-family HTH domain
MDVSKQLVSHWETGRSEITVFDVVKVAKIVGVDVTWLLTGIGSGESNVKLQLQEGTAVPNLDPGEILDVATGRKNLEDINKVRYTQSPVSARALCFDVFDRAMEPRFEVGHIVVVDPERIPEPGDCILVALLSSQEIKFGRYKPSPESRAGQPPFTLEFDNRFFEPKLVTLAHQPVFLGTMIEHVIIGSR